MPPSAVPSKCRHGSSRDIPLRACRGLRSREEKPNLGWRRALECLDRKRDVNLAQYDRRHRELHRAIKELEKIVPSCHSREAAATVRVSLRRELASAENSASLDVAPSYSRGRDETSRTGPNALLEPAQPDFLCSALNETKLEPTFGLRGKMDEFRRLKVTYPTAPPRELADFQVFAETVAARRQDEPDSEDRGEDNREDTGDDCRRSRHSALMNFEDSRVRRPGGRPSAGSRWDETSNSSCTSSDPSSQDIRRRSHRRGKEKNQDHSAGSAFPSRLLAPEQPPAPSLPRPQHIVLPTVHRPAPSEPASEKPSTLLSEISFRPNQREGVNRKCYASLDTKGLMKVPTIPFDTADGNSQINLVNSTAFWIPGWHKPLMRHVLNSVSHHYLAQVTRTKQMVRDAFARAEADERSGKPERQILEGILRALCLGLNPFSPNQALQQLQTLEVPEKISFADFLSELHIAVMNIKSLALVPPDDSTVKVVVKASIDDQFATLAASILAGRIRSAIPSSIIEGLLDSLGDLTLTRAPAIVATRFSKDSRGRD